MLGFSVNNDFYFENLGLSFTQLLWLRLLGPCPKWNTSCALAVLQCARPLSPRVPFLILAFRRVSERPPLRPLCALDPHFCRAHTWASSQQTSNSQSGIMLRKCGLRGRPRGFRVTFGTGPWNTRQESRRPHLRCFCGAPPF